MDEVKTPKVTRSALNWKNALRVRMVVLSCIVIVLGVGSQVLVNVFAANANADMMTLKVTAYAISGRMADGQWTYLGACSVDTAQFPFGTVIALYNADGSLNRQCTAEDTASGVGLGHIDLAMPGDEAGAIRWGVRYLSAQVLRWGWDGSGSPVSGATSTPAKLKSLPPVREVLPGQFNPMPISADQTLRR